MPSRLVLLILAALGLTLIGAALFWMIRDQSRRITLPDVNQLMDDLCSANLLEDCNGQLTRVTGEIIESETLLLCDIEGRSINYPGLGNCLMIDNPAAVAPGMINQRASVIGLIRTSPGQTTAIEIKSVQLLGSVAP